MVNINKYLEKYFIWKDNWYFDIYGISVFTDCEKPYIIESNKNESFLFSNIKELKKIHKEIIKKYYKY